MTYTLDENPHAAPQRHCHPEGDWSRRGAAKRAENAALIPESLLLPPTDALDARSVPELCERLTTRELEITGTVNVQHLLTMLAKGMYTAVEVAIAFQKRALIAQQLVSASAHDVQVCGGIDDRDASLTSR